METGNLKQEQKNKIIVVKRRLIQNEQKKEDINFTFSFQIVLVFVIMASLCTIFTSSFSISFTGWIIYPVLLLFSFLFALYYDNDRLDGSRLLHFVIAVVCCAILVLITWNQASGSFYSAGNEVIIEINRTYQGMIGLYPTNGAKATYFLLLVFFWIGAFLAKGVVGRQDNYSFMFITFPILMFCFLAGGSPSKVALLILLLAFLSLTAASSVRVRSKFWGGKGKEEFKKNQTTSRKIQFHLTIICAVAGTILVIFSFYAIRPGLSVPLTKLSGTTAPVKNQSLQILYEILPKITGGKLNLSLEGVGGGVSNGELGEVEGATYDGSEAIRITSTIKPEETIYLKGFIGTEYVGDRWYTRNEKEFSNAVKNWKTEDDPFLYIQNLPFLRMMYAEEIQEESEIVEPAQLKVERFNANPLYTYVPYQAYLNDYYEILGGDGGVASQMEQEDVYSWYPTENYQIVMENWIDQEKEHGVLDELASAYESYVIEQDTKTGQDGLKRLEELCQEKKQEWDNKITDKLTKEQTDALEKEKYEDIKKFVILTLWENCSFVAEAKKLPEDEDFIDYFMFEVQKGDSTAFASAAVMIFRMCGIPARYVVGYAAPEDLFSMNENGNYTAILQDDNAHAWAEIYMPDMGWSPVETTPGFFGTVTNLEIPKETLKTEKEKEDTQEEEPEKEDEKTLEETSEKDGVLQENLLFIGLIFIIAAIVMMFELRRQYICNRRRGKSNKFSKEEKIKRIFYSFYEVLEFTGFSKEIDTTEPEFIEELIEFYPALPEKEAVRLMKLVLQAHYGYEKPKTEDVAFVVNIYEKLVQEGLQRVKGIRKLIFRFWKAF
ncbi:MAG: transglutaminase domain-containing protein [Lachnospiraceae bacterium]|nr:transglutaminase domain-containing protein [Lachnospiraceae bacterium]